MPETILIDALAGTLPEGFCPKGPTALQQLYDEFVARTQWSLAVGIRFINFGDTVPVPELQGFPWLKTVGGYPDRFYTHLSGAWLALHPIPAGPSGFRAGWVGTSDELLTYDGGLNEVTTITSGPFWEIDHDFDGRSPMGPGVIPGASPAKTLSAGENYGTGAQLQSAQQMSPHTHPFGADATILNADGSVKVVNSGAGGAGLQIGATGTPATALSVLANTFTGVQEATPIVHPVRGLSQIKRTIRKYYRGT